MTILIMAITMFLILLLVKFRDVKPAPKPDEEYRTKDREMAGEIIQALRDTRIIKEFETIDEEMLQPYARRLWETDCPAEQIQIGLEVADVVSRHAEIVRIDPVLHRRSQFTLIVNPKLTP